MLTAQRALQPEHTVIIVVKHDRNLARSQLCNLACDLRKVNLAMELILLLRTHCKSAVVMRMAVAQHSILRGALGNTGERRVLCRADTHKA